MKKSKVTKIMEMLSVAFIITVIISLCIEIMPQKASSTQMEDSIETTLSVDTEKMLKVQEEYAYIPEVTGVEKEALFKKLDDVYQSDLPELEMKEALGEVYVYDSVKFAASSSGDIVLNKPTISYNTSTKTYTILGIGSLSSGDIKDEVSFNLPFFVFEGKTKKVGGVDGVAISITNTSGYRNGLAVVNGYGLLNGNPPGGNSTSTTMVTENDRYGVGYEVVDKIYVCDTNLRGYTYQYNASSIKCKVTYNDKFAYYSGDIKLCYSHTWKNTDVNSISVGKDSVSFGWDTSSNKWTARSNTRTFSNGVQTN